jgi:hypothetical protein
MGEKRYSSTHSLPALHVEWSSHPTSWTPVKNAGIQRKEDWVGPRTGLENLEKIKCLVPTGIPIPDRSARNLAIIPTELFRQPEEESCHLFECTAFDIRLHGQGQNASRSQDNSFPTAYTKNKLSGASSLH